MVGRDRELGVLLVVEDVHSANPETLKVLEYLADNLVASWRRPLPRREEREATGTPSR
jgi:hypothetical protein